MSAPTRAKFLARGRVASPAKYLQQQQRLAVAAACRAEQIVFCRWVVEELGHDLSPVDIDALVDEYNRLTT